MKKLYTLLTSVITLISFAQAPQGFNYQATVRNSSGALVVNQNVNFNFNVMLNSPAGASVTLVPQRKKSSALKKEKPKKNNSKQA